MRIPARLGLAALAILLVLASPLPNPAGRDSHGAEPSGVELPEMEKLHLYLLIGQSNMAGRGRLAPADRIPVDSVVMLTPSNDWTPASHPLHSDRATAGVGLGIAFARAVGEHDPSATIGLIPCAVGGTPLERWEKGGDLYRAAVERARIAMRDGTLKGILWHQGERDAARANTATTYGRRLVRMVRDMRRDLGRPSVPFVVGELGRFGRHRHTEMINQALNGIPRYLTGTAVVSSRGLGHQGDRLHFDVDSLRELGRRYASAALSL
jgi:hypothetical protein